MHPEDEDRNRRISQLQALAEDEKRQLPRLDQGAFDTALSELAQQNRRNARLRRIGWKAVAVVILVAAVLFVIGLR